MEMRVLASYGSAAPGRASRGLRGLSVVPAEGESCNQDGWGLACTAGLPVCATLKPVGKVGRDAGRRGPQGPLELSSTGPFERVTLPLPGPRREAPLVFR